MLFRSPRGNGDQAVLNAARAFARDAAPLATEFIGHDMPEKFLEDLHEAIKDFEEAIRDREAGKGTNVAARTAIDTAMEEGLDAVRRLDAIVPNRLMRSWTYCARSASSPRLPPTPTCYGSTRSGCAPRAAVAAIYWWRAGLFPTPRWAAVSYSNLHRLAGSADREDRRRGEVTADSSALCRYSCNRCFEDLNGAAHRHYHHHRRVPTAPQGIGPGAIPAPKSFAHRGLGDDTTRLGCPGLAVCSSRRRSSSNGALRLPRHSAPILLSAYQDDVRKNFTRGFGVLIPDHHGRRFGHSQLTHIHSGV